MFRASQEFSCPKAKNTGFCRKRSDCNSQNYGGGEQMEETGQMGNAFGGHKEQGCDSNDNTLDNGNIHSNKSEDEDVSSKDESDNDDHVNFFRRKQRLRQRLQRELVILRKAAHDHRQRIVTDISAVRTLIAAAEEDSLETGQILAKKRCESKRHWSK